ncbi:MAG: Asp-tRNA(Asn)/Glu-tRNA(Gln) amidotransferase subunit GatB [Cytophagales bacterium]|jgi:aspartyl-tRNA(Asn)/glutamyl-tRNA(Gln) amidotransferase subunit B|nr:Asp-tRNA(Asn)/Glu-tRNA(Gln) amidotransferase subunit GatB [Cytophagales bacterium]
MNNNFKPVIGLEIHMQLTTKSKIFSPEKNTFGEFPNTFINPISLAHPGTLPTINKETINSAISLGIACKSEICRKNYFARKNYFYPDLTKGYQITQDQTPICQGGEISFSSNNNEQRTIKLNRIHIEEDTAKLIHDLYPHFTCIDFNRAGIGLLELVTAPEIKSPEEAYAFLYELRRLVRYINICDGDMEKGSLRCDANISVMPENSSVFGQRVEVKNINSIKNVQLALEYEIQRQTNLILNGEKVAQETRTFDADSSQTLPLRSKENTIDYRYFVEPDLPVFFITDDWIEKIKSSMPSLPEEYKKKLLNELHVNEYNTNVLIENKQLLNLFEKLSEGTEDFNNIANWILGPIKGYLNEYKLPLEIIFSRIDEIKKLIKLVDEKKISHTSATQTLLTMIIEKENTDPLILAQDLNLIQNADENFIEPFVKEVISAYPDKVEKYKLGKRGLLGFFVGEVIKKIANADPAIVNSLVKKMLDE